MNLGDLRLSYLKGGLTESDIDPDPFRQFDRWFKEARASGLTEPNAMGLATASANAQPSSRMVLLKDFNEFGFVWYTNYESRKGRDLACNPRASLLFYWQELERQISIEGFVTRVPPQESDEYFRARPRGHQIGAWASRQSEPIPDRAALERQAVEAAERFHHGPVPRPNYWGGYRLAPDRFEFWQGRPNRMHDRIEYTRAGTDWKKIRLSP